MLMVYDDEGNYDISPELIHGWSTIKTLYIIGISLCYHTTYVFVWFEDIFKISNAKMLKCNPINRATK